jgi:hypothetical protein
MRRKIDLSLLAGTVFAGFTAMAGAAGLPRVEAHIHYSHDAWEVYPLCRNRRVSCRRGTDRNAEALLKLVGKLRGFHA